MFKLITERTFKHRIRVQVPVDGGHREESFKATYRVMEQSEAESFDLSKTDEITDFLRTAIVSLDEIADANGDPLPYNDDVRDAVLNIPYTRLALVRGYFDGIGKSRKGN